MVSTYKIDNGNGRKIEIQIRTKRGIYSSHSQSPKDIEETTALENSPDPGKPLETEIAADATEPIEVINSEVTDKVETNPLPIVPRTSVKALGGNLYQKTINGVVTEYLYRRTVKGESSDTKLGRATVITEDEARRAALRLNEDIDREKRAESSKKLLIKVKETISAKNSLPCFKTYEDVARFVTALSRKIPLDNLKSHRPGSLSEKEAEAYLVIWIMLLTPISLKELIQAEWGDYAPRTMCDLHSYEHLKLATKQNREAFCFNLPKYAEIAISNAAERPRIGESNKIFHLLSNLQKDELNKEMARALNEIWPYYPVDPQQFVSLFEYTANKYSCFRAEFIRAYTKKQHAKDQWLNYPTEHYALSTWWEKQVLDRNFGFQYKPESKTTIAARTRSNTNRGTQY
ncbi:hypothetical protein ACO0LB_06395 [Undibacterium sp. SXout7W]|uniref:hypothetical protein n=1 Tax=Undibacterium sp. SXout7W TaxID=3413049 RepID=UPI003BF26D01